MDAINKEKGPCVILAGAGTGKTYAIVEKIKHLISKGIYKPGRIVCMTFSNEAANELLSRVRGVLKDGEEEPIIRTFHGFSADLLRKYGERIGIDKEFKILDPNDAKILLHGSLKVNAGNCHKYISALGIAKDLGISIDSLEEYLDREMGEFKGVDLSKRVESLQFELQTLHLPGRDNGEGKRELVKQIKRIRELLDLKKFISAWRAYEKIKKLSHYLDYSDLNRRALELMRKDKSISEDFDYFIVDEFQDTNKVQLDLLELLGQGANGITIVGDMNQSIYRFRGAYKENYNEFKEKFKVGKENIFNLDKSFRSPDKVLRVAHKLILNNYENKEECFEVKSFDSREGGNVEVYEMKDGKEEARKVVEMIKKEIARGVELEEICVMFRTHQQGRVIKRLLEYEGIEFSSVGKGSLLKQRSVKTVIDYLTILHKLKRKVRGGEQAWWDLAYQSGFSQEDLIKIGRFIKENRGADNLSAKLLSNLTEIELSQEGKMVSKILSERIKLAIPLLDKSISELILGIYNSAGLVKRGENREEKEIMLNLNKFYELAKGHEGLYGPELGSFINYLDVVSDLGIEIPAAELEEKGVRLMTLHATKGLEFKTVIITNMAQKRFPMVMSSSGNLIPLELYPDMVGEISNLDKEEADHYMYDYDLKNQMFEERRLSYVAFTRAKENLILTYAAKYGNKRFFPSQFLEEVRYKGSGDINFNIDIEERYEEPQLELKSGLEISKAIGSGNFEEIITNVTDSTFPNPNNVGKEIVFSPSALLLFDECQKKYEYKYKYNMPEDKMVNWEAIQLGGFVHVVLEQGVYRELKDVKQYLDLAREIYASGEWESADLGEAEHLIRVFYERNKGKVSRDSKTEQKLNSEIAGMKFTGFADRIDFSPEGLEIVDYKTGRGALRPRARNWQMGYYALAASKLGKVKRITLDMLKQEKPLEFELGEDGVARAVNSARMGDFNIYEVEGEIVRTAHAVLEAYEKGFRACSVERNCEFCNEYVYGL